MMDFEKQRIELEKAAKSADLKNKDHKQQVDCLLRILDDAKEKVKVYFNDYYSFELLSE